MRQNKPAIIFGITGGSGSGKSYTISLLPSEVCVISMDKMGHLALEGSAKDEVLRRFGTINRKELGEIVFAEPKKLAALNQIIHPYIVKMVYEQVVNKMDFHPYIFIDGALLFELKLNYICDKVILVLANFETKIRRIMSRDKISRDLAEKRLRNQRNFEDLKSFADIIIYNE